jgi:YHS domain-containing protein
VHRPRCRRPARLPAGPSGHAHRPAVERDGDWFGATVNLAARVSAAAGGGEALLTGATKAAAGEAAGVELRERGRWSFRKVAAPVPVYAAIRQGAPSSLGLPIDPVCRMAVDPWHGGGRLTHRGVEYGFCSRVRRRIRPAPRQLRHDRSPIRPRPLIGIVTGGDDRRERVDGRLVGELGAAAQPFGKAHLGVEATCPERRQGLVLA